MMIHSGTMPFDWIISSNEGAAAAIESGFAGRLQPEQLELKSDHVIDHRFGFVHVHEFPIHAGFLADYQKVVERQRLLERRFQSALKSKANILFVRHESPGDADRSSAQRLVDAIGRWRPVSSFHLLYLTDAAHSKAGRAGGTITIRQVSSGFGDSASDWDSLISDLHSDIPIKAYYPGLVHGIAAMPQSVHGPARRVFGETRRYFLQLALNAGVTHS